MPLLTKVNNTTWYKAKHWVKTGTNSWTSVPQIYVKTGAGWKPLYKFSWEIGAWGTCSKFCDTGTQNRTVRCKRADGQYYPDSVCQKFVSAKPSTVQNCNTHTCTIYARGNFDDCMWLHTLTPSNTWRQIYGSCGGANDSTFLWLPVSSPEFAYPEVKMAAEMKDTNGTSYHMSLQMCTAENRCSERIVYFHHQGECDGAVWYFTWNSTTLGFTRYRCTDWRNQYQGCTRGCSGCTDSGWGYLNCTSGAPSWCYIKTPNSR